jgi:chloramphenicol O-acetyltransferase type A
MKVLMFGWEFPPHISGGLGTACYGMTTDLECTGAYRYARSKGISFFLYYLYLVLKAVNGTEAFLDLAVRETERVRLERRLISNDFGQNIIHFSALPWIRFSSMSHPRHFGTRDSIPKITVGKFYQEGDRMFMPVSVHLHHALADGLHVGQFLQILQRLFTEQSG